MSAVLVISGPSGSGKSSLIKAISKDIGAYYFSISTTTRKPREGEQEGVDYYFVDHKTFIRDIKQGHFLEYAEVHGNFYGTSLEPVHKALEEGKLVIFDIDVQGHDSIKRIMGHITTSVFLATPTLKILEERLTARATDEEDIIQKRLMMAETEIEHLHKFDYVIVNDEFEQAAKELLAVTRSARVKRSKDFIEKFLAQWS
jgi:guanylate kinase